jgi:prohibitin 1
MYSIVLDDVSITHLSFSEEFTRAIEQKQVASQEAERAKFVVEKGTSLFNILARKVG